MLNIKENIKYFIVGGIGLVVNYTIYWFLRKFILGDIAWLFGVVVSAELNYILNRKWTFRS